MPSDQYEYVIVGSGAGGGTLAARLALAGRKVLLLEAGGDPFKLNGSGPVGPAGVNRLPADYQVPTFHTMASENDAMKWDFWVRHYADLAQQSRDTKYYKEYEGKPVDGVLYPRAGTLGGCTAHNAMIMVYPANSDWDGIAKHTGDPSWGADKMRGYFERLENCYHRPPYRWLQKLLGLNPTRHGFAGWLSIQKALPLTALGDIDLIAIVKKTVRSVFWTWRHPILMLRYLLQGQLDPNDWRLVERNAEGLHYAPLATAGHARNGTREFVLDVAQRHPDRLTIELDALVTKVLFDNANRAIGVDYLKGARLYRASHSPNPQSGEQRTARASREVILSGGAYNTPQLLMLSGIGPKAELDRHGIPVRINLPGVGTNLQDRYEVGVVLHLTQPWEVLKGAKFSKGDPQFEQWEKWRKGVYTTNGAAIALIKRSDPKRPVPDLFLFAVLGYFKGYLPGYSKLVADKLDYLTWTILKGHTNNRGGTVTLRSSDPRDPPQINFHYFQEGTDKAGEDLDSVVDALEYVRKDLIPPVSAFIKEEELPGNKVKTRAELAQFVKDNAWGHHASCTCQIGPKTEPMAVLDSNFRVHGTSGLRVVDASVFPRIPGLFIVSSVYMIAEKAADAILADAH
jgi:choline dehydrogenase-like flavoprotein